MSDPGELISTAADFPHVRVYERGSGDLYTIAFDNREFGGWRQSLTAVAAMLALAALIPGSIFLGQALDEAGYHWVIAPVVLLALFGGICLRLQRPWRIKRAIELDAAGDALRVLKNGHVKLERQLTRLANLTVEDHPDAEFKRVQRMEKGKRSPSDEEKQHCLIGWFGARGAEQVILLSRAEWPCRHSLQEVQQAVIWALNQAARRAPPEVREMAEAAAGIKPPLD